MTEVAIQAEGLSKRYRVGAIKRQGNRTLVSSLASAAIQPMRNLSRLRSLSSFSDTEGENNVMWALRDVSFELMQGEALGVIGRNGSGKSTLLKILSKITEPTTGQAKIRGRMSSLLEVGTGFHPQLTGRENAFLNGAILGMKKAEIDKKFDQIVDFSGVEKFIDTPVKHYSSGMKVRLAFAVAAHLEPEILLIDEVLAVGDAEFQQKCLGRMNDVASDGRTVIFVSHNMGAVMSLCNNVLVLDQGAVEFHGDVSGGVSHYRELNAIAATGRLERPGHFTNERKNLSLEEAEVTSNGKFNPSGYFTGDPLEFRVRLDVKSAMDGIAVGIGINNTFGERIAVLSSANSDNKSAYISRQSGMADFTCNLDRGYFAPGIYSVDVQAESNQGSLIGESAFTLEILQRKDGRSVPGLMKGGYLNIPSRWSLPEIS